MLRLFFSNLRGWHDEYCFDWYRFDGVTSLLYHSRGIGEGFSGDYDEYFGMNLNTEALVYLALANQILHELDPNIITVAEVVSGMPVLCRPVSHGRYEFDYRLGKWIEMLKEQGDEEWNINKLVHTLTNSLRVFFRF